MENALNDLIERVQKATGPDREIDALVAVWRHGTVSTGDDLIYARAPYKDERCAWGTFWSVERSGMSLRTAPKFTDSLDEVVALIEKEMPGAAWSLTNLYGTARAELPLNGGDLDSRSAHRKDGNVVLALLTAFLRAKSPPDDGKAE